MERLQGGVAVVGVGPGSGGSGLRTPTKARICGVGGGSGSGDDFLERKRKRSAAGLDSSPGSLDEGGEDEGGDGQRRTPVVKRACNECRQQKVCALMQQGWEIGAWTYCEDGLLTHGFRLCSFDVMLYRTLSTFVVAVADWVSTVGSSRTSNGWESAVSMRKWNERSSS